ncbi:MAG: hypothetical protein Q7K39_02650 [Candidatus Magasanikbacteria bacterium]|nr:hypothetical protein [Candidatus Magasanikbacteria bacterium]
MLKPSKFFKIRFYVPLAHAEVVRSALFAAGAGQIGNYSGCSASWRATGRFTPESGATPFVGKVGREEVVEEEVVEMLCHEDILPRAISVLKKAHPYESPAIDIMPRFEIE